MDSLLFKYQCVFIKGFSAQHYLLPMLVKQKNAVDEGKVFGAFLTNLLKTCDCLSHELKIAKLSICGFNSLVLQLV